MFFQYQKCTLPVYFQVQLLLKYIQYKFFVLIIEVLVIWVILISDFWFNFYISKFALWVLIHNKKLRKSYSYPKKSELPFKNNLFTVESYQPTNQPPTQVILWDMATSDSTRFNVAMNT